MPTKPAKPSLPPRSLYKPKLGPKATAHLRRQAVKAKRKARG